MSIFYIGIILNSAFSLLYGFGRISRGNRNVIIEFIGGSLLVLSFIAGFFILGLKTGILLILITLLLIIPITGFIMGALKSRLYKGYKNS